MNSQQLEYFCKVAEAGSFSRAALAVGINQSALSRHVRNLEEELGVQLFYRNGRGVILTEVGSRLFGRASRALEEIAEARDEALNSRTHPAISVTIGLPPSVGRILVVPTTRQLREMFPNIKLHFIEGLTNTLIEWLDAGRLDVAILYKGRATAGLQSETLLEENLSLIGPTGEVKLGSQTPASKLGEFPLILPSRTHRLRQLTDSMALQQRIQLDVRIEADSLEPILALVIAGYGYTVLPSNSVHAELSRGEVQTSKIVEPELHRTLVLAVPSNQPRIMGLSQIAKTIKATLRARP